MPEASGLSSCYLLIIGILLVLRACDGEWHADILTTMSYWLKCVNGGSITGPFSLDEIRSKLADLEIAFSDQITPNRGQSVSSLGDFLDWSPLESILAPDGSPQPTTRESRDETWRERRGKSRYRSLREAIEYLWLACVVVFLISFIAGVAFVIISRSFLVGLFWGSQLVLVFFVVFALKHLVLLLADLVDLTEEKGGKAS